MRICKQMCWGVRESIFTLVIFPKNALILEHIMDIQIGINHRYKIIMYAMNDYMTSE